MSDFPTISDREREPLLNSSINNSARGNRMRSYTTGDLIAQHNRRVRMNSTASSFQVDHQDTASIVSAIHSIRDYVKERYPSLTTQKFVASLLWALIAVGIFNLIFLPRTSLGRDYRRIHFSTLSRDETQRLFLKSLSETNNAREYLSQYSGSQHFSGDGDEATQFTIDKLREFGLNPRKEIYYTYMNRHVASGLTLLDSNGSAVYEPSLCEIDEASGREIPAYHGYSASGNITGAKYVYVNYGTDEDYEMLQDLAVDIRNKIHIVRTGKISMGLKVRNAQLTGALGVVTYTDPSDDGDITVKNGFKAYPAGPARSPKAIQRGNVLVDSETPGDPTTPGYASKRAAKRKDPERILPKIPSIPISFDEISPILAAMNGTGLNLNWYGNVPNFDYSTGPSNFRLSLYNKQDYDYIPIKNIIYEIPGLLNERVFIGNHRDSWSLNGAGDPNSGSAILLEISRAFGDLIAKGWKPMRTIMVASWDAEEFAELGSTEFGEDFASLLKNEVVAYINLDRGIAGPFFKASSNPLLDHFLIETSKVISFKGSEEMTLCDYWSKQNGNHIDVVGTEAGSGASVFQHHLGIPSCMVSFQTDSKHAPLHEHSNYDTMDWIERFVDPHFEYHNTLAKYTGFLALTFSEHEVIDYKISHYAQKIKSYLIDVVDTLPNAWLTKDVRLGKRRTLSLPLALERVDDLLVEFIEVAEQFDRRAKDLQEQISIDWAWFMSYKKLKLAIDIKILGTKARMIDRLFLHNSGLKSRPWMKHVIFAPDRSKGMGDNQVLPSLNEAIEDDDFEEFAEWLVVLKERIQDVTNRLRL